MKRYVPLALILAAALLAIVLAERQKVDTQPSPQALLDAAADAEHEASRVPFQLDRMSDDDEVRIGDEIASSYERKWEAGRNTESAKQVEAYLQQVGSKVAAHATRKLAYRFHFIPDAGYVNAFALPGGHVFVGEGLLRLMQSEDALAAVLGHEVEHIDLRHCAERVQTEGHLQNLGTLGALAGLPVEVFMAGYSKQQEMDADRYGTALAVATGYAPAGILQLFDEFEKLERKMGSNSSGAAVPPATPVDEAARISVQTLQDYFRSHPPAAERKQQIEMLVRTQHWPNPPLRPLRYK
jgi:predicted Zn-dependent protease